MTRVKYRRTNGIVVSCVVLLATIGATGVANAQTSPALNKVIAAAKAEGTLNLFWAQGVLGGVKGAKLLGAGMNKKFGTNIRVKFTPGPSMGRTGSLLAREYATGQKASSDAYIATAVQITPLLGKGLFMKVNWAELLPGRIGPNTLEADSRVLRMGTGVPGITYNSKLAPFKPKTLADFLKPEWKGKIASTPYAATFDYLMADDVWGKEKTLRVVRQIADQIGGLMRCSEFERIATGEFWALVMDCTGQDALILQEKGAPVAQVIPSDVPAQKRYYSFAIPKNAPNPNAAKLFTTFMVTEEGQKLAWDTWKIDLHFFKESRVKKRIDALESQGLKFGEVTVEWLTAHPEVNAPKRLAIKILTGKK